MRALESGIQACAAETNKMSKALAAAMARSYYDRAIIFLKQEIFIFRSNENLDRYLLNFKVFSMFKLRMGVNATE